MSFIKVPSWFELLQLGFKNTLFRESALAKEAQEEAFWKEQALRFGFDIRQAVIKNNFNSPWQSFFYEKFFQYTLKRVGNSLHNLKLWEKNFWKRNGRYIERIELTSISPHDLKIIIEWFPNLKWLTLNKCRSLLQGKLHDELTVELRGLKMLTTLEIKDAHFLTSKSFGSIPPTIEQVIINRARGFGSDFFDILSELTNLRSLAIQNSHGIEQHFLSKLPKGLTELDLSNSGSHLTDEALLYLPQSLRTLKLNKWDHFGDKELTLLPANLTHLEIEGWSISPAGLQQLEQLPLLKLSLARTLLDRSGAGLIFLPRSLKKLNLSQNCLTVEAINWLDVLESLEELDLSYLAAYDSKIDDEPINFPSTLKSLILTGCGRLHKKTMQRLKSLIYLKVLSLEACSVENADLDFLPEHIVRLNLSLCTHLTDVALSILKGFKQLQVLELDGCEQIRGFGLSYLSDHLKKLSLAGCNRLSGKSLAQLPEALEELSLDYCELITSNDIKALPHSLQVLSLAQCPHIGNEAIDFLSTLPLLNTITLTGCSKITDLAIAKLVRRKFEGTIVIKNDIELHPPISMLKKLLTFKARLLHKLNSQALR